MQIDLNLITKNGSGPLRVTIDSLVIAGWAGRDAEAPAVLAETRRIAVAGEAIRALGMRFNAGHALNYYNVQPIARLHGLRELHIGHSIVSRSVFVGLREAVAEMKRLLREAALTA